MILIIDFGGQTAHLIARRLRDMGVDAKLILPEEALRYSVQSKITGIIFSGGPMSVYEKGAPTIDTKIFSLSIPILGICYGFHLIAHLLSGEVISGRKEYGPATLHITNHQSPITNHLPNQFTVWMNHGDEIVRLPEDFIVIGETARVPFAFSVSEKRKICGILFHPEVEHTEYGTQILKNFVEICEQNHEEKNKDNHESQFMIHDSSLRPEQIIGNIKKTVGTTPIIGAVSGGVDSTVAAALVAKAVGKQFTPIFVNNGLMRPDAEKSVKKLARAYNLTPIIVQCEAEMLKRLAGITDSEEKRKVIGKFYIEIFEREVEKLYPLPSTLYPFLLQGTIYSDFIESQGTKHASKIKSHHNVGGLPEQMKLRLLEPLRELYKDEVRQLGRRIGLDESFITKQPFPGPGYAVRIRGEVTQKRLHQERQADAIVLEELQKANWLSNVFISFPVMTGAYSTAVKGDAKFFGEVIALRVVQSTDIMTSTWAHLPYDVLQSISSRIVNEVSDISRVVYDISTKPPATMEWE